MTPVIDSEPRIHHLDRVMRRMVWALLLVLAACDRSAADPPPPAPSAEPVAASPAPPQPEPPPASAPPSASVVEAEPAPPPRPAPTKPAALRAAPPAKSAAPVASAAEPPRKVTTVRGTSAGGEGFAVSIQAQSLVQSGKSGSAVVVLSAKAPYKCNEKYPYKFVLEAPGGGISYPSQTVRGMAVSAKSSSMSVPFSATQAGSGTIAGVLHFSVCTADKCLIEKRRLAVTVQVD